MIAADVNDLKYERITTLSNAYSYWFKAVKDNSNFIITTPGTRNEDTVVVQLYQGWNMIGNPFAAPVAFDECIVEKNGKIYSTASAQSAELIDNLIYWYEKNSYVYGGPASQIISKPYLTPWTGNWIYAINDCKFIIPFKNNSGESFTITNNYSPQLAKRKTSQSSEDWLLNLSFSVGGYSDKYNFIGVMADAIDGPDKNDIKEAPANQKFASLYFEQAGAADNNYSSKKYTSDFKNNISTYKIWNFKIKTDILNTEAVLKIENLKNLPDNLTVVLVDEENNQVIELNSSADTEYHFMPMNLRSGHRFALKIAAPEYADAIKSSPGVDIAKTYVYPNPAYNELKFRITSGSQISKIELKIFDISGQNMHSANIDLSSAGASLTNYDFYIWDLKNGRGQRAASGSYIYQMKINYINGGVKKVVDKFAVIR